MVDDPNMIQWLIGQAGIGGLAAMALYTLNANHQTALRREREYAEANREDKTQLLRVLSDNTSALTKLTGMIETQTRGIDRASHN
jgi:hypothetical protein